MALLQNQPRPFASPGDPYNLEFGGFGMSADLVDVGDQDQPVLLAVPSLQILGRLPRSHRRGGANC